MQEPRTATVLNTQADKLNPGDQVLLQNGQTSQVRRVRPHETSPSTHVYVDTDQGTTVVQRTKGFQLAPTNSRQQMLPGYGNPGGNSNQLPWHGSPAGNAGAGSGAPTCPNDGSRMLQRGTEFVCPKCGHTAGQGGASGANFTSAPRILNPRGASKSYSTVNNPQLSVVAKVASAMADKENNR